MRRSGRNPLGDRLPLPRRPNRPPPSRELGRDRVSGSHRRHRHPHRRAHPLGGRLLRRADLGSAVRKPHDRRECPGHPRERRGRCATRSWSTCSPRTTSGSCRWKRRRASCGESDRRRARSRSTPPQESQASEAPSGADGRDQRSAHHQQPGPGGLGQRLALRRRQRAGVDDLAERDPRGAMVLFVEDQQQDLMTVSYAGARTPPCSGS